MVESQLILGGDHSYACTAEAGSSCAGMTLIAIH